MNRRYLYVPILASAFAMSCGGMDPTMDGTVEDDEVVGEATATVSPTMDGTIEDDEVVGKATAAVNTPDKVLCYIKKGGFGFRRRIQFYGAHRTADGWNKVSLGRLGKIAR